MSILLLIIAVITGLSTAVSVYKLGKSTVKDSGSQAIGVFLYGAFVTIVLIVAALGGVTP